MLAIVPIHRRRRGGYRHSLFRFLTLTGLLLLVYTLLAFGPVPEVGPGGGVIRRNVDQNVDATPLFYTDHDSLPALERELLEERERLLQGR